MKVILYSLTSLDALVDLVGVNLFSRLLLCVFISGAVGGAVLGLEESLDVKDSLVDFCEILDNIFVMFFNLYSFADVFAN